MGNFPLRGNRIEIRRIEGQISDRRKYQIYIEKRLLDEIRNPEKWEENEDIQRMTLGYEANPTRSESQCYPLRGEGIELRQSGTDEPRRRERSGTTNKRGTYSIYVESDLAIKLMDAECEDDEGYKKTRKGRCGESHPPEYLWVEKDGRYIVSYYAIDNEFAPAASDIPCT